jgi:hypothetical protein
VLISVLPGRAPLHPWIVVGAEEDAPEEVGALLARFFAP